MSTSFSDLTTRVLGFLADPKSSPDFPTWFASQLAEVHNANDPELETAMHAIQRAFSEGAEGLYTPDSLAAAVKSYLGQFSRAEQGAKASPPVTNVAVYRSETPDLAAVVDVRGILVNVDDVVFGAVSPTAVVRYGASGGTSLPLLS
ncbi:MAG: hypothetical protein WB622_07590, partial [Acidobacteriaceae bacterium]